MPLPMYKKTETSPLAYVKNIIGVAAGKGGVGKSTVAVNLAQAFKYMGYNVGIMDTDIYGPSVRQMLPEDTIPTQNGQIISPAICGGIKMISMAYFRNKAEAAVVRSPIANSLISQFIRQVDWGHLDYLIIDFPPGTGDIQLTLCQQANISGAVMVTTPQEVALLDVRKAMHMFDQVKVPILGVVENMSYYYHKKTEEKIYIFGQGGGERLALEEDVPYLGGIAIDPEICQGGDLGQSVFSRSNVDKSVVAQSFLTIAKNVMAELIAVNSIPLGDSLKKIYQKDKHTFSMEWKDGVILDYRLSDLQKICPCAGCVDENTGKRFENKNLDPNVTAAQLESVGHYALKIAFTSGCSNGIYTYDMLRKIENKGLNQ